MYKRQAWGDENHRVFELSIERADDGRGAGSDFDSSAHRYTDWYQRTDEEGENVDYDFRIDTWSDGYDPNSEQKET